VTFGFTPPHIRLPLVNKLYLVSLILFLALGSLALGGSAFQDEAIEGKIKLAPLHIPAPAPDGRPKMLEGWESMDCVECHKEIAQEWAGTLHALAWVDERYQEAIANKRRPQSCHGCHIPQPLNLRPLGGKPRPRNPNAEVPEETLHTGISCISCHQGPEGEMLGPFADAEPTDAHASKQGAAFGEGTLADAICINCHRTNVGPVIGIAKDFETTRQADKGLSCVGCHMSAVDRPAALVPQEDGSLLASQVRRGRSHALQTPRDPDFLAGAFGLEARLTATGAELLITNQAGHRVPGLKTRSMTFTVTLIDADGESTHLIDSRSYLPVDGTIAIAIEAKTPPTKLHVKATHLWAGVKGPVVFIDKSLNL
jgi:hypothetical protein